MAYRQELKYIISAAESELLVCRLQTVMQRDPYAMTDGMYQVRSLYFDDVFDTALTDVYSGVPLRKKYRLRMYNMDPSFLRLEKKVKTNGFCMKSEAVISEQEARSIVCGADMPFPERRDPFLEAFYAEVRSRGVRPRSIVQYTRTAFLRNNGNVRITVDKDIRVSRFTQAFFEKENVGIPVMEYGECILEVKFDHFLPDEVLRLLSVCERQRSAFSKYAATGLYGV